jgi:hypothetical protein
MLRRLAKLREKPMHHVLAFATAVTLSAGAFAQSDKGPAAPRPPAASSAVVPSSKTPTSAQLDMQMKSMQQMHDKMMAATTPQERQALMSEHMQLMQDGMAMMGQMRGAGPRAGMGGGMPMDSRMMGRRMDMMESMMQMMMDREAVPPAGK